MGSAVSGGAPVVATQMGESVSVLPLSGEYPRVIAHHEYRRIGAPSVQEADEN